MVTIESGPGRVLGTGTVTTFGGGALRIRWASADDGLHLFVELVFVTDSEVNGANVTSEALEGGVRLSCVNFEGDYGRGTALPVAIATLGEEVVLFHFRALRYGQSPDWTVHWTLYCAARAELT
jgi:hypothetical protein